MEDKFVGRWIKPESDDLREMVGRKGHHDIETISEGIAKELDIQPHDRVLDLCCGNGLITEGIAPRSREVHGVDFSDILIGQALASRVAENITYHTADALDIDQLFEPGSFDKAYCALAFQYFNLETGALLMKKLSVVIRPGGRVFITDIPDATRKWAHRRRAIMRFLGLESSDPASGPPSPPRWQSLSSKLSYIIRQAFHILGIKEGDCTLGWWWHPRQIKEAAKAAGFTLRIIPQCAFSLHAHYRFDVIMTRR